MPISPKSAEKCPRCGIEQLDADLDGLCPSCLFSLAASAAGDATGEQTGRPGNDREGVAEIPPRHDEQAIQSPVSASPRDLDVGRIRALFPELEIERTLGQGGMGIVYLARQKHLNRPVALKIIAPEIAGDPTFSERFSREAKTTARLTHGNVAMVFDFGEVDGLYFMIMEYVEGRSLRQLLLDGAISTYSAVNIVVQVCNALNYAHHAGVVHRDIKPENVIVGPTGHVKVVDFGLAKLTDPAQRELALTATRQVMGTPRYMSPEQMDSPQSVDHRSDIYSAGVILYELLTGELPTGHFVPPSQKGNGDVHLDEVVMRALAREPERRFQTIADFRSQLEAAVGERRAPAEVRWPQDAWPQGAQQQLDLVAKGIHLAAAFQWFVANLVFLYIFVVSNWIPNQSIWVAAFLATGIFGATLSLFGGWRMLRRESYWSSVAACAASMVCFPSNIIGLPLGIIGLSMLMRDDVRQQFAGQSKASKPSGTSVLLLTSSVMNVLMIPMFITFVVYSGSERLMGYHNRGYFLHSQTFWMMIFGVSAFAGPIQLAAYGLSRAMVLRPLVCLVLVAGLFAPGIGWVAAVIAFGLSFPTFWKWRVFAWLRRYWSDWAVGIVGFAVLCGTVGGGATVFYHVLSGYLPGTYEVFEHSQSRGARPRSLAYAELKYDATGVGACQGKAAADLVGFDKVVWRVHLQHTNSRDPGDGELTYVKGKGFRYLDNDGTLVRGSSIRRDDVLTWLEASGVDVKKPGVGLEAAVIAETTEIAVEPVRYGSHPGVGRSLNRAAFSEPYGYGHRRFHEPTGVLPVVILVSILTGLALNVLWIRSVYRRARLRVPGNAMVQLPQTQFGKPS